VRCVDIGSLEIQHRANRLPQEDGEGFLAVVTFPSIDPIAFHIGSHTVRWYGLAYLLSFVLSYLFLRWMIREGTLRLPLHSLGELLGTLAIGLIVGGRVGWWLAYHRGGICLEPWYEPIAVWHGGMSMHGGMAGTLMATLVWSRVRHAAFGNLADCLVLVVPLGIFFVRIANLLNGELIGRVSHVPWAVVFPGEVYPRHPSQLYEALLAGPLLFAGLWLARRWLKLRAGHTAAIFFLSYGVLRFCLEFARNPDGQLGFIAFGWMTMGQILSLATIALGGCFWWWPMKDSRS
jgi:phosphatidylglycerol:prolipoprotein diacylglycerol transferase